MAIERLKDKPLMELELKVCESQISNNCNSGLTNDKIVSEI